MYECRRPREIAARFYISILFGVYLYSSFRNRTSSQDPGVTYFGYAVLILCAVVLGILFFRSVTSSRFIGLELKPESIVLSGEGWDAESIKAVYIKGYFKPVVGLKPKGKLLVPYNCCFCFLEKEDQGIGELTAWAERNHIKVLHKRFERWI